MLLVWRITGIKVAGLADGVGRWHTFELPIVVVGDLDEDVVLLPDPERTSFVADHFIGNMNSFAPYLRLDGLLDDQGRRIAS